MVALAGGQQAHLFGVAEVGDDFRGIMVGQKAQRLDRALCLAALGRREEARRMLLRTGDSRFQDDVDRTLEQVGTPGAKR